MKFCLHQQLFAFNECYVETRLSNIFKTTKVTKLTEAIPESSYRALQVTFKWKALERPVYNLMAVEFWPTFDIQIDMTLAISWQKLHNYTFSIAHSSLLRHTSIYSNRGHLIKHKKYVFFWWLLFSK